MILLFTLIALSHQSHWLDLLLYMLIVVTRAPVSAFGTTNQSQVAQSSFESAATLKVKCASSSHLFFLAAIVASHFSMLDL